VEDEFLVRMLISEELRTADFHVIEAVDAEEALAALHSGIRVDLIFSDVRMPGPIDGLGLLAAVQQGFPEMPVIMTSGHLQRDTAFDAPTAFLPKPYTFSQAIKLIEDRLKARR
jgi:DNA-binding NtrC family response regulator